MRLLALGSVLAGIAPSQDVSQPRNFRISLSVSPFAELRFATGTVFTDGHLTARNPRELQSLFVAHGANEVYVRIATTQKYRTGAGDHSMDRALARARMAAALNLPLDPELGLFNIYGDVRCQPPPDFSGYPEIHLPGAWPTLSIDQMLPALRAYGAAAARQILSTGVKVRIWDIGNEVEFGFAGVAVRPAPGACDDTAGGRGWYRPPDAVDPAIGRMSLVALMSMPENQRIAWLQVHLWPHTARMLAAVADGIQSVEPHARFSTHASGITSVLPAQAVSFYKTLQAGGFAAGELGLSYYPTSSATPPNRLRGFQEVAAALHREFGRPVFISEFAYPAARMQSGFIWNNAVPHYPQNAEGQAAFIRDLVAWGVRTGTLSGIRPWAPDLAGPGWGPMSLFELNGKMAVARPSLGAFIEGVRLRTP